MQKDRSVQIFLDPIAVNLRIGLYDHERAAPQRVLVEVALYADPDYLAQAAPDTIIDYAVIYEAVRAWEGRPHVELIEALAQELVALCFELDRVTACRVSIKKADIFGDNQGAGVDVFMRREDFKG